MIDKIISGGQTGVERAALDVAIDLGITHGGYISFGCKTEYGTLPKKYTLTQIKSSSPGGSIHANIKNSDATLLIVPNRERLNAPGPICAASHIDFLHKPSRTYFLDMYDKINPDLPGVIDFEEEKRFDEWLTKFNIRILNVCGTAESRSPGVQKRAYDLLYFLLGNKND